MGASQHFNICIGLNGKTDERCSFIIDGLAIRLRQLQQTRRCLCVLAAQFIVVPDKTADDDFYILTLAAIACELEDAHLTEANVYLAVGLPLTWTAMQKAKFADYLSRNEEVRFIYKKVDYHIRIVGVKVYPQGYAAVAPIKSQMTSVNLVADIGNGTMNVLYIVGGRPQSGKMFTEKFGTYQCTLAMRAAFMRQTQRELNDAIIDEVFRTGTAGIKASDLAIIRAAAKGYEYMAELQIKAGQE